MLPSAVLAALVVTAGDTPANFSCAIAAAGYAFAQNLQVPATKN